jgi:serine/threonine protein kinase
MDVVTWLKENKLDAYDFEAEGYDDIEDILSLTTDEANDLAGLLKMKSGHRKKLLRLTGNTTNGTEGRETTRMRKTNHAEPLPPFEPGTVFANNFELEKRIGSGGMGQVWRAYDRALGRTVAVKVARGGGNTDRTLAERMEHEVKAVAACIHDSILIIYSAHFQHEPIPFVVCEDLGDTTLYSLARARSPLLSPHNLSLVAVQLLEALTLMHSKLWVHRDVKPSNIMWLQTADGKMRVKLIDFGIAKSQADHNLIQTTTGCTPGTQPYMGPLARSGMLDPRCDLWALAITLAECLMGELPSLPPPLEVLADAANGVGPSHHELQRKHTAAGNPPGEQLQVSWQLIRLHCRGCHAGRGHTSALVPTGVLCIDVPLSIGSDTGPSKGSGSPSAQRLRHGR